MPHGTSVFLGLSPVNRKLRRGGSVILKRERRYEADRPAFSRSEVIPQAAKIRRSPAEDAKQPRRWTCGIIRSFPWSCACALGLGRRLIDFKLRPSLFRPARTPAADPKMRPDSHFCESPLGTRHRLGAAAPQRKKIADGGWKSSPPQGLLRTDNKPYRECPRFR